MNNKKTTGYDEIKGMLKTLRSLNETRYTNKTPLNEAEEVQQTTDNPQQTDINTNKKQFDNVEVVNDVEVKLLSTDKEEVKLKPEEKTAITQIVDSFRQQVSQIADLDPTYHYHGSYWPGLTGNQHPGYKPSHKTPRSAWRHSCCQIHRLCKCTQQKYHN